MKKIIIKVISNITILTLLIIFIPVNAETFIPKHNYVINYYKDSVDEKNWIETIIGKEEYTEVVNIDTSYKIPEGYTYTGDKIILDVEKSNQEINVIYTKKNNLSYCINYFYDGIISVNNTECFYNQQYGKEITSFIDKPREGYVFDGFDPITVLDIEENIMNVYYKSSNSTFVVSKNPSATNTNIMSHLIKLLRTIIKAIN